MKKRLFHHRHLIVSNACAIFLIWPFVKLERIIFRPRTDVPRLIYYFSMAIGLCSVALVVFLRFQVRSFAHGDARHESAAEIPD
jgi:hypothetical protein